MKAFRKAVARRLREGPPNPVDQDVYLERAARRLRAASIHLVLADQNLKRAIDEGAKVRVIRGAPVRRRRPPRRTLRDSAVSRPPGQGRVASLGTAAAVEARKTRTGSGLGGTLGGEPTERTCHGQRRAGSAVAAQVGSMTVLLTLASGQFLMALDSSVMNVSIATVAEDLGTTVTGIQTAITLYTLVMASLMITGGKIGQIMGRKRAFALGCIIYGAGSLTTSVAPNLTVLLIGWSLLEGMGAALIMPAIVALVASNFGRAERPKAYGLVAASAAIAVAVGP